MTTRVWVCVCLCVFWRRRFWGWQNDAAYVVQFGFYMMYKHAYYMLGRMVWYWHAEQFI